MPDDEQRTLEPRVEDHWELLSRLAAAKTPRGMEPEELLNDAYLIARRQGVSFTHPGQLVNWYRTTMEIRALEILRRQSREYPQVVHAEISSMGINTSEADRETIELLDLARRLFEALPDLERRLASAWILHAHEGHTLRELAAHFVLEETRVHRHVSTKTLSRRLQQIQTALQVGLQQVPDPDRDVEADAVFALTEALVYVAERQFLEATPEVCNLHHRLVNQLTTLLHVVPTQQIRLLACLCYLNDMMRDLEDPNGQLRRANLSMLDTLRRHASSSSDNKQVAWAWFNFLISERHAGLEVAESWRDLSYFVDSHQVSINDDMKMNVTFYAKGLKAALEMASRDILTRKGPHAPSLLLRVAQWHILDRQPRRARTLLESLPTEGLTPDYKRRRDEALEFCRRHHNDSTYDDVPVPQWVLAT